MKEGFTFNSASIIFLRKFTSENFVCGNRKEPNLEIQVKSKRLQLEPLI